MNSINGYYANIQHRRNDESYMVSWLIKRKIYSKIYDKKSETEQVVAIRNRIKFIYEITKTYLKYLTRYR